MGKSFNTGLLTNGIAQDSSNNIGIGGAANASYKLAVTGASLFTGAGTFSSSVSINGAAANYDLNIYNTIPRIQLQNPTTGTTTGDGLHIYQNGNDSYILNKEAANFYLGSNNGVNLTISSTGAATFSSSVQIQSSNGIKLNRSANDYYWQINSDSSNYLNFGAYLANGTAYGTNPKMILLDNGNVGIGTSSPSTLLHLNATTTQLTLQNTDGGTNAERVGFFMTGGDTFKLISLNDNNTTRVDNILVANVLTGNVGIGHTPSYTLDVLSTQSNTFRLLQNINGDNYININNTSTGTAATSRMDIGVNSGSYALTIQKFGLNFSGTLFGVSCTNSSAIYDNSASSNGLFIGAVSSTPIIFGTSNAERMRITSGGNLEFTGTSSNSKIRFWSSYSGTPSCVGFEVYNASGATMMAINGNGGSVYSASLGTGAVYSNGGTLTNTNPSDERLKDNITDISWGLSDILKLRPVSYHWKDDTINQGTQFGFIAQEVQDVMPEAIKEFGGDVKYLGLEKDAIYATLVKAIQELKAEIDELKAK